MDERNPQFRLAVMVLTEKIRKQGHEVQAESIYALFQAMAKDSNIFADAVAIASIFKLDKEADRMENAIESMEEFLEPSKEVEPLTEEQSSIVDRLLNHE